MGEMSERTENVEREFHNTHSAIPQFHNSTIIVNALTFSRLPLIFTWLGFAMAAEYGAGAWAAVAALAALFLSGITDFFDGSLARRWNVVTPLGKMADPLMDKAVYVVVFPSLTWFLLRHEGGEWHSLLMLAFTILYTLRDLWVTFLRSVASLYGANTAAMWLGKVRTALSFPTAGLVYCYVALLPHCGGRLDAWLLCACYFAEISMIILNVASFITYTRVYAPYLKKALERRRDL